MSDGEALSRAIIEQPGEDTPRLAYADWLDEQGDSPSSWMALFIRNSIRNGHDDAQGEFQRAIEHTDPFDEARAFGLPEGWAVTCYRKLHELRSEGASPRSVLCVRGFPAEFACNLPTWQKVGPAIVKAHPVTTVRITDRTPTIRSRDHTAMWVRESGMSDPPPDELPSGIFDLLPLDSQRYFHVLGRPGDWRSYPEIPAADALSAACIAWAKSAPDGAGAVREEMKG